MVVSRSNFLAKAVDANIERFSEWINRTSIFKS